MHVKNPHISLTYFKRSKQIFACQILLKGQLIIIELYHGEHYSKKLAIKHIFLPIHILYTTLINLWPRRQLLLIRRLVKMLML